jgi:transcription elongation GreA/GreB family factor
MPDMSEPATTATERRNRIVVHGSRTRVQDTEGEHEYTTRATGEAAPGSVSVGSPVGRALLGRGPGQKVWVQRPGGIRLLTVVDVVDSTAPSSAGGSLPCEA